MNRSGGAESQNWRRLAKFSRLVETVKLRVEWPGKMPGPAPDSHSVLANSSSSSSKPESLLGEIHTWLKGSQKIRDNQDEGVGQIVKQIFINLIAMALSQYQGKMSLMNIEVHESPISKDNFDADPGDTRCEVKSNTFFVFCFCEHMPLCLYGNPSSMGLLRVGGTKQRVLVATMPGFLRSYHTTTRE